MSTLHDHPRRRTVAALLAAVTLAVGACGGDGDSAEAADTGGSGDETASAEIPDGITLTVAEQNGSESVAYELSGAGEDAPYAVEFADFNGGPAVIEAVLSGGADVGYIGEAPLPIAAGSGVDDLVAIAARANPGSSGNYYLVAQPDSDISSVEDLAGRKVAYPPGTGRHMIVAAQLDAAGLSLEDDVEGVELAGSEVAPTFASGSVDAAIVLGTQWFNLGEPPVIDDGAGLNWGLALLVVRRDTLEDAGKVAAIGDYVRRSVAASNWSAAHVDEWVQANYVDIEGLTAEQGQYLIDDAGFDYYHPIDEDLQAAFQEVADGLRQTGAIEAEVDVASLIDGRFNDQVTAQNEADGIELPPLEQ